ncbi:MAG: hypothetical protein CVV33_04610 [Methanomicrobiales archaeon HGW-Methanomicrobiales-4]|nr:MAG: hypothetical protein CVV33_04610 [Methanomicrobiales archaeon HGW-Methanomicrobiales-4]
MIIQGRLVEYEESDLNNGKNMNGTEEKLCPFDKKECIRMRCAIWATDEGTCSLALISQTVQRQGGQTRAKERSVSSGLSGKYRDPLFD